VQGLTGGGWSTAVSSTEGGNLAGVRTRGDVVLRVREGQWSNAELMDLVASLGRLTNDGGRAELRCSWMTSTTIDCTDGGRR
jgi:hypothetical protein